MSNALAIFFGAAFTVWVMWSLGRLLFRALRIHLLRFEHDLLAGVSGAPILSLLVFLLCVFHAARTPVFLLIGIAVVALNWRFGVSAAQEKLPPLPVLWKFLFGAIFSFYALFYLSNSLAPEISPDGQTYHLGLVYRFFRDHGFHRLTTNVFSNMPLGFEMLFLFAFSFGGNAAAATLHCCFLLALPILMLSYARRMGHPRAGVCAALIAGLAPVAGIDGVSAYNDVALATSAFAMFYLLEIWRTGERTAENDALLVPIGLLAGFCVAIKLTGFAAPLYAAAVILMARRLRALLTVASTAAILVLPWLIKDWIWLRNPLSPFFNRVFPNPYVHVQLEDFYREWFVRYNLTSFRSWFPALTVGGGLGGQIGPVFLLAPCALLALRSRAGRQCLLAAAFFLAPYPLNIGARFIIPALPFIALSMALAFEFSPAILAFLTLAAALAAWPRVIDKYDAQAGGWHILHMPWKPALHIVPQDVFLARSPQWRLAQMLERSVPTGKRVWSTVAVAEAYTKADVMLSFQSAEGELLEDTLTTAARDDLEPTWNLRFRIPPTRLRHLRMAQTAAASGDLWNITEVKIFDGQNQIPRTHAWRLDATPFPWDIGLAFDGNVVTRWRSWESIHPGMHIDVDFGAPVLIDRVELHDTDGQPKIRVHPEACDGPCAVIAATIENLPAAPYGDLRRQATRITREHGIDYLLMNVPLAANDLSADIRNDPGRWGLEFVAECDGSRLYRIQ